MARINNLSRDIHLLIDRTLSPHARQQVAAKSARKILADAQTHNKSVLGVVPPHKEYVDGKLGVPLETVNTDRGHIVFQFELGNEILRWIGEQLVLNSPVLTGQYARSHVLLADGVEIDADGKIPAAETYTFTNIQPYSRKIERGLSDQAEDGVFEVVAALAAKKFGNVARIRFTYVSLSGTSKDKSDRQPAITVSLR